MSLPRILWTLAYALRHGDISVLLTLPVWIARVVGVALGLVLGHALWHAGFAR